MRSALARLSLCVSLAGALSVAGCSRAGRPADAGAPVLTFTNESIDVTTVYAIRPGGDAVRLASVSPGRTTTLDLPASLGAGGTVRIVAVPLAGSQVASTGPISIGPGTRLAITLPTTQNILTVLPAPVP